MTEDRSSSFIEQPTRSWLAHLGVEASDLVLLTGDVSLRHYVRVWDASGETSIVAVYPTEIRAACRNFVITTQLLSEAGVRVPRILANDCESGFTLVEDVGSETLYDVRDTERVVTSLSSYFWRASEDIERIQRLPIEEVTQLSPALDGDLMWQELGQTWSCLLEPRGIVSDSVFARDLETVLEDLCKRFDRETFVPCHRDFMTRNLVPLSTIPEMAILDHQDLRLGPRFYDLASLLNDSLFPPDALEEEILNHHVGGDSEKRELYHRAAAQRTLKATGTYEKFALRGFDRHRKLIPGTIGRALRHLRYLPEVSGVIDELERQLKHKSIC